MDIHLLAKFWWDISIHGQDKTTSGFGKGTAAILELCFRFRSWPMCSHRQVILHQPVKFRHNRTIGGEVDVISIFQDGGHRVRNLLPVSVLVMVRVCKMEIYWHTKFRWDISIHGRDKTTSGFGKRTAAILDFYFRFLFFTQFSSSACHSALAYHISSISSKSNNPWRSYDVISFFFKMAACSHIGFDLDNITPPTKCSCWSVVGSQIWSWSVS